MMQFRTGVSAAVAAFCVTFGAAGVTPAVAEECDRFGCGRLECATPALPAPATLWGDIRPAETSLPLCTGTSWTGVGDQACRDSTPHNEFGANRYYGNWPFFVASDVENGYLIAGLTYGLEIFDLRTTPGNPTTVGVLKRTPSNGAFRVWAGGEDDKYPLRALDAPDGVDTVAALIGSGGIGVAVADLSVKSSPKIRYQHDHQDGDDIYTARIGGQDYAFAAVNQSTAGTGVYAYNMTAARNLPGSGVCLQGVDSCPGVFLGKFASSVSYVHGVDNFLVASRGAGRGLEIYDVTNPANPSLKLSGYFNPGGRPVDGVAMWKQGSTYYLAARLGAVGGDAHEKLAIFNVSCISSSCSGMPAPIYQQNYDVAATVFSFLTFSRSGSRNFLYLGADDACSESKHEWLLDVSNPAQPFDVTPAQTITATGTYSGVPVVKTINYWGWYYRANPTGFNRVAPRRAKFYNDHMYRAAGSILDIHRLTTAAPPASSFTYSPAEVYAGDQVDFTDTSSGAPTGWSWTFQDGAPGTSTVQSPQNVLFSSVGGKSVTLQASNGLGAGNVASQTVNVLDPAPQVASVGVSPTSPTICQPLTFTGNNVTGRPPLTYAWTVRNDTTSATVATGTSNPFVWNVLPSVSPGAYTATLVVSGTGSAQASAGFNLGGLTLLPGAGDFAPTNDPFSNGTVQFHVNVPGATEWNWSFGDGGSTGWINDPVAGPNPVHTYTTADTFDVTVQVRNCIESARTSDPLAVTVTNPTPLVAQFQANNIFCTGLGCFADTGFAITFADQSTGDPDFWDYDWNGDGDFTDAGDQSGQTGPVSSHVYSTAGTFSPKLRVRRGPEQNTYTHNSIEVSTGQPPPPVTITISGSSSGQPDQALTFTAGASGCSPNSSGWTWTTGGGVGSSTTSSISITWASVGTKTVTAKNSACGATTDSHTVTISTTPVGTLAAAFTYSPTAPAAGQAVAFDGRSSTGSPAVYLWHFGDGTPDVTGSTVSHTFNAVGTYPVRLTVTKPGSGPGCFAGNCASELTVNVVVGSGQPPIDGGFTTDASCTNVGGFSLCDTFTGQPVGFTANEAAAGATYAWNFGDGSTATGRQPSHSFGQTGIFIVSLHVTSGSQTADSSKTFTVTGLDASFTVDVPCTGPECNGVANQLITFTATTTQGTNYAWNFGDGSTGSGRIATHRFTRTGRFPVVLTVSDATRTSTSTKNITIVEPPTSDVALLLPFFAWSEGTLVQVSDFYAYNPGSQPLVLNVRFYKRGTPDVTAQPRQLTIAPHAARYVEDALGAGLFNLPTPMVGFLYFTWEGTVEPAVNGINRTFAGGVAFGQSFPAVRIPRTPATVGAASTFVDQHVIGLADNTGKTSSLGLTNPNASSARVELSFFNRAGQPLRQNLSQTLSAFGQKIFQTGELRALGVTGDDYRVVIKTISGGPVVPFGSMVRTGSQDQSYVSPSDGSQQRSFLLGVVNSNGALGSVWRTDAVIFNPTAHPMSVDAVFTPVGLTAVPTRTETIIVEPLSTRRLEDVIFQLWGLRSGGTLSFTSSGVGGVYPVMLGERYEISQPNKIFGQAFTPLGDSRAASIGESLALLGLRNDTENLSWLYFYNPGTTLLQATLIYRAPDGQELARAALALGAGVGRQIAPGSLPAIVRGRNGSFTVEVQVTAGQVLGVGQVVSSSTNDPTQVIGIAF